MSDQSFFWSRLRWRFRGAWMWPAFATVTLGGGLLLHWLPPVRTGIRPLSGILLATFGNLFLIGLVGPWLTRRLAVRRGLRPEDAERDVLQDRVGTALLLIGLVGILAAGLAARPLIVSETEQTERAAQAVYDIVERSGNAELVRNRDAADSIRLREGYFRICIPDDDRERFNCWFVDSKESPAKVVKDRSVEPNGEAYAVP
jgi:hypothetical protein